ncbi:MAG: POTRA domain-containing protein [Pirellulaceae bacterium]|nr:POTRA domain-containing protein [Pirellulaceae bacterium]
MMRNWSVRGRLLFVLFALPLFTPALVSAQGPGGPNPSFPTDPTFRDRVAEAGGPAFGPTGPQPLIREVVVKGNETIDEATIFQHLHTRRDREYDGEVVQADVRRLAGTGKFRDVKTYRQNVPGGVVVTFEVFERPTIRFVKFIGNRGVGDKHLMKTSGLRQGDAINKFAVEEGRRKVEDFYRGKGFSRTQVEIAAGDRPEDRGIVYVVREGPVERINSVRFVGNAIASNSRLKTQIQSKPGVMWYLFRGKVDRDKINQDVEKLTAYYRNLGYFNARIGRELQFDRSGRWLDLIFVIDEGPRYVVRNVNVSGNVRFAGTALLSQLELKSGQFFNQSQMEADLNTLRDLYGSQGHIFVEAVADPRFLEQPGQLDLTYNIDEGDQFRVGDIRIHIAGEFPHTRQNVVLNRISLKPGDIVDIREVRASERRLRFAQLFENNPAQGVAPRIVIRPPELNELESLASDAPNRPRYRGQGPQRR